MNNTQIKYKLKQCFKKCADGRKKLRNCVVEIMDAGLTKQDVLDVADEMVTEKLKDEVYLCAVTAIGQALRYEEKHKKNVDSKINIETKKIIKNKLKKCFNECGNAKMTLRKCVTNALNTGMSRQDVLAITDDIVGNFGKEQVSVCAIVAVEQVLMHDETEKLKNIIKGYAPYMEFSEE